MPRVHRLVRQRGRIGMAGEAFLIAHMDQDLDRDGVIAREVRHQLFSAAGLLLDEARQAGRSMAVQARGRLGMRRRFPGLVVELHLVAGVAEPGLFVHPLEGSPAGDQGEQPDPRHRRKCEGPASFHWAAPTLGRSGSPRPRSTGLAEFSSAPAGKSYEDFRPTPALPSFLRSETTAWAGGALMERPQPPLLSRKPESRGHRASRKSAPVAVRLHSPRKVTQSRRGILNPQVKRLSISLPLGWE